MINVEELSETDVGVLRQHYQRLAELVKHDHKVTPSDSVEEARRLSNEILEEKTLALMQAADRNGSAP